jgi:hypothetical protein
MWVGLIALAILMVTLNGCSLLKSTTPALGPEVEGTQPSGDSDPAGKPRAEKTEAEGGVEQAAGTQAPDSESTDNATYTPTIAFLATIVVDQVDVHTGPGYEYPVLVTIDEPITVRVIGVNQSKTWFFILLPDNQQGWIRIEAVDYKFDLNLLPVVKETPTPTTYGAALLVPPQLLGVTPASTSSPARGVLSVFSVLSLGLLILGLSGVFSNRGRPRSWLPRLLSSLISLL